MLTDILTKDVVRLDVEGLTTPEEVIHFSGLHAAVFSSF